MKKQTTEYSNLSFENATFKVNEYADIEFENCNLKNVKIVYIKTRFAVRVKLFYYSLVIKITDKIIEYGERFAGKGFDLAQKLKNF